MTQPQPNLATEQRLRWLIDRLHADGSVTIVDSALALDVSEMTIRRDLVELEERGVARRVRGGAMPVGPRRFSERKGSRVRAKAAIAAKLLELIPPSGMVAFDASSTVMRVAAGLTGAQSLTVLTNGPDTFQALQQRPGITATMTGGSLDIRTGSLVGPLASWSARQVAVTQFIMSCAALDPVLGATELTLEEADVKRSIGAGAGQIVLAADSSKLGQRAEVMTFDWSSIDVLVTELDPSDPRLEDYRKLTNLR